jgi:hypothetical protein
MPTPLELSPEDHWGDFTRTEDRFAALVSETGFRGILIDAPALVPIDRRESAPVVGYYARSLREDLQVVPERQMLAAALDLSTKRLRVGLALDTGKTLAPEGPPATDDPGEGATYTALRADLRAQLDLPWEPRKYLVAFLLREHLSNAVVMELGPSAAAFRDAEVERFLVERRKRAAPLPPPPISPVPSAATGVTYERLSRSPPVPEQPGIALEIDRVAVFRRGASCLCFGSFRLPVAARDLVRPDAAAGAPPAVGDPRATAIIPVTLVATGSESSGPWTIELRVPSYDAIPPADPALPPDGEVGMVTGHFALDLFQHPGMPRKAMTYFVTAFGGASVSGPFPVAIVTEKMLRDAGASPT